MFDYLKRKQEELKQSAVYSEFFTIVAFIQSPLFQWLMPMSDKVGWGRLLRYATAYLSMRSLEAN